MPKTYRILSSSGTVFTLVADQVIERTVHRELIVTFVDAAGLERSFTAPREWAEVVA